MAEVEERHRKELAQVKALLTKGWPEEALRYVQTLLDDRERIGYQKAALPYISKFEHTVWKACHDCNVIAAFVVVERETQPDNTIKYVMHTGGHHIAEAVLSYHLQPLKASLGQDPNPAKPYWKAGTDIVKIERRLPWTE